jgi:phage/plasmid-associated DNA primase
MRLVVCSEVGPTAKFHEQKIKHLTGGDQIKGRFLYGKPFTFDPSHHMWLMGNHQPRVDAGGESFWRRLRLVGFEHTVPEERADRGPGRPARGGGGPGHPRLGGRGGAASSWTGSPSRSR